MFVKKLLGLLAIGGLLIVAAPTPQAQAASPLTPGAITAVQQGSSGMVTQVQHRRHYHRHYHPRRHYHHHHRYHYVPRVYRHHYHHRHHHHHHRRW
jgi:hypothetical protein